MGDGAIRAARDRFRIECVRERDFVKRELVTPSPERAGVPRAVLLLSSRLLQAEQPDDPKASTAGDLCVRVCVSACALEALQLAALHKVCGGVSSVEGLPDMAFGMGGNEAFHAARDSLVEAHATQRSNCDLDRLMELVAVLSQNLSRLLCLLRWICRSADVDYKLTVNSRPWFVEWLKKHELS